MVFLNIYCVLSFALHMHCSRSRIDFPFCFRILYVSSIVTCMYPAGNYADLNKLLRYVDGEA